MSKTWIIGDTHFSHNGTACVFQRTDGRPLRPFSSVEEQDKVLINNWNSVVKDEDRVYHLGDVCMGYKPLNILTQLKGRKVLIKGNHDDQKLKYYLPHFDDIRAYVVKKTKEGGKLIFSHVPLHPDSLGRFGVNIHGHLHGNYLNDPNYLCVSAEHIGFTPISFDECLERIEENRRHFNQTKTVIDYSERYVK